MKWLGALALAGLLAAALVGCGRTREKQSARVPAPSSTGGASASAGAAAGGAGGAPATGLRLQPWQLEAEGAAPLVLGLGEEVPWTELAELTERNGLALGAP